VNAVAERYPGATLIIDHSGETIGDPAKIDSWAFIEDTLSSPSTERPRQAVGASVETRSRSTRSRPKPRTSSGSMTRSGHSGWHGEPT